MQTCSVLHSACCIRRCKINFRVTQSACKSESDLPYVALVCTNEVTSLAGICSSCRNSSSCCRNAQNRKSNLESRFDMQRSRDFDMCSITRISVDILISFIETWRSADAQSRDSPSRDRDIYRLLKIIRTSKEAALVMFNTRRNLRSIVSI